MRLSSQRIETLRALLRELHDLELTDEQTQEAGLAIMRFVKAKSQRKYELIKKDSDNGQPKRHNTIR